MSAAVIEVCVDSLDSASSAAMGGADRLELCSALSEGGLTPSLGLLRKVKQTVQIPVFVLVRPRQGDFLYSEDEIDIMVDDIVSFRQHGADGFVFGCLQPAGTVNESQCRRLLAAAAPRPCTFHRAFDLTSSPTEALDTVSRLGFSRVLTSGQAPTALQGAGVIGDLVRRAASDPEGGVTVLAGGGVTPETAAELRRLTGVTEAHGSARSPRPSAMTRRPVGVTMGQASDETQWLQCDPQKVKALKAAFLNAV